MRIKLTSIMVDDQEKALRFYYGRARVQEETRLPGWRVSLDHGRVGGRAGRCRARARAECQSSGEDLSGRDVCAGYSRRSVPSVGHPPRVRAAVGRRSRVPPAAYVRRTRDARHLCGHVRQPGAALSAVIAHAQSAVRRERSERAVTSHVVTRPFRRTYVSRPSRAAKPRGR